jgi:hypothetical protein
MQPAIGYDLASARFTGMRQQAQRDALARAARQAGRARTELTAGGAWCQALFTSGLQRSDAPGADGVAAAIRSAVARFSIGGCTGRMAQEFGDHPEAAAERMRWARSLPGLATRTFSPPTVGRALPAGHYRDGTTR